MKEDISFSKEDTLMLKGIAICMMLFHHLFGFPERIPNEILDISLMGGGFILLFSVFF